MKIFRKRDESLRYCDGCLRVSSRGSRADAAREAAQVKVLMSAWRLV